MDFWFSPRKEKGGRKKGSDSIFSDTEATESTRKESKAGFP
jgi:hypothetical protein